MNRSAQGLLIVTTTLNGFNLTNCAKFTKLSTHQTSHYAVFSARYYNVRTFHLAQTNYIIHCSIIKLMTDWFCVIVIVIVTTGASCLGELLKVNNSLQKLDMGYNVIGDDGMSSVADGLQYNKSLKILDVQKCGLSVKGIVVYKTEFKII